MPQRVIRRARGAATVASCLMALLAALAVPLDAPAAAHEVDTAGDPAYSVEVATLDAALDCTDLTAHPDKEPVLLVHGTFTHGHEQYDWNYGLILAALGYDYCIVTYPNRGLDDIQVSSEYVARAIQVMHQSSGRRVDVMGHSQGALLPRWALRWWPSVRAIVDDLVAVAGPNHGTDLATLYGLNSGGSGDQPAAFQQMAAGSKFITALNSEDETPGDVDYTSLYSTLHDELVQPDGTVPSEIPTAALDWDAAGPHVTNVTPQQLCRGRVVDHLTIGTTDLVAIEIVLDAFSHPGPADLARLDGTTLCLKGQFASPDQLPPGLAILSGNLQGGFPEFKSGPEPELAAYARSGAAPRSSPPSTPAATSSVPSGSATGTERDPLPRTGGDETPLVPAIAAIAMALALRRLTTAPR